jgi:cell division septation protein DedD
LVTISLLAGCGPKAPERETVMQPPPPSPVEELESRVSDLEVRQSRLAQRRTKLQEEFSQLKSQQEGLETIRDEVLKAQQEAAERAVAMREIEAEALEAEKPLRQKEAPSVLPPVSGGPGRNPYVVHTSSFRNPTLAFKEARQLSGKGYGAYVSEADLGAKGKWRRVLMDRFPSAEKARSAAESFKAREKVSYAAPMRLPFSVALEGYKSAQEANRAKENLEGKKIHPYVVEESGPAGSKVYRLMFGAYGGRAEAEAAAKRATSAGAAAAVVTP